ncbi:MAG: DUF1643 domain-containing protein [Lentisphaeria bacterium]|nr:DUF1643 domain-containing protein [Lentisphaeria bacterium]
MKADAVLSDCRTYRYSLWRIWDDKKKLALFIGLNPSTADETSDDPTLKRCMDFAKSWGYGGVCMANLFAYRATQPSDMMAAQDPVGAENDKWLLKLVDECGVAIAAWGNDGKHMQRSSILKAMLPELHYLKLNKSGEPAHPLYLPKKLKPIPLAQPST